MFELFTIILCFTIYIHCPISIENIIFCWIAIIISIKIDKLTVVMVSVNLYIGGTSHLLEGMKLARSTSCQC